MNGIFTQIVVVPQTLIQPGKKKTDAFAKKRLFFYFYSDGVSGMGAEVSRWEYTQPQKFCR